MFFLCANMTHLLSGASENETSHTMACNGAQATKRCLSLFLAVPFSFLFIFIIQNSPRNRIESWEKNRQFSHDECDIIYRASFSVYCSLCDDESGSPLWIIFNTIFYCNDLLSCNGCEQFTCFVSFHCLQTKTKSTHASANEATVEVDFDGLSIHQKNGFLFFSKSLSILSIAHKLFAKFFDFVD